MKKATTFAVLFVAFCVALPFMLIKIIAEEFREYRRLETFDVE